MPVEYSGVLIDIQLKEKIATKEDETIFNDFDFRPGKHSSDRLVYHVLMYLCVCGFSKDLRKKTKKINIKKVLNLLSLVWLWRGLYDTLVT